MPTTDPNPPVTSVDTTAVTGATGPLPFGTARVASNADTTIFGGGGGEDPNTGNSNLGTLSTDGTNSPNGATFVPVVTGLAQTPDSIQGNGGMRLDANPAYRAPSGPVAASNLDTTRTDSPTSGTVLVINKSYVKSTKIATIVTDGTYNLAVGQISVLLGVDANLDGAQQITAVPSPGTFRFSTDKPPSDIVSAAVVGGSVSVTTVSYMSGTQDSATIGAVPVTNLNVPLAPTGAAATANNDGTVTVSWTDPAAVIGAPIRGYLIESQYGYIRMAGQGVTSFTTQPLDLEAGKPTTFQVRAINDNGSGPLSAVSNAVAPVNVNFTGFAPGVFTPDAVTSPIYQPDGTVDYLLVGMQNRNSIVYTWILPGLANLQPYSAGVLKIYNAATGVQVGSDHALSGTAVTYTQGSLTYGTSYYATVGFTDTASVTRTSDPSLTVTLVNLVPVAAAAPTAVDATGHVATVTYADPADTGNSAITSHVIQWSSDSFATVAGSATDAVSPASAATGAGTWKFRVAAINAVGQGAFSVASANVTIA